MPGKMIVGYLLLSFLIAVVRTNSVAELVGTWTTKSRSVVTGPVGSLQAHSRSSSRVVFISL